MLCMIWRARNVNDGQAPHSDDLHLAPGCGVAFYHAFEAKDIDAMMAAWAEDEEIVCVHPGGPRLVGYEAVRAGWEQLFASDTKLSFSP